MKHQSTSKQYHKNTNFNAVNSSVALTKELARKVAITLHIFNTITMNFCAIILSAKKIPPYPSLFSLRARIGGALKIRTLNKSSLVAIVTQYREKVLP